MCSNGRTISWENTNLTNNSYTQQFMIYYKICRNENILFQHKYKYTLLLQKKSKWFIIHIICTTHTPYNFRAIFQLALFTRHFFNLCLNNKSGCSGISPDQFQIRQTQASKKTFVYCCLGRQQEQNRKRSHLIGMVLIQTPNPIDISQYMDSSFQYEGANFHAVCDKYCRQPLNKRNKKTHKHRLTSDNRLKA